MQIFVKELPEFSIPVILSFLEVEHIVQCASVAKVWASSVCSMPSSKKVR